MEKTLHLPDYGYNLAAALFYIFYAAFEVGRCISIFPYCRLSVNLGSNSCDLEPLCASNGC